MLEPRIDVLCTEYLVRMWGLKTKGYAISRVGIIGHVFRRSTLAGIPLSVIKVPIPGSPDSRPLNGPRDPDLFDQASNNT